MFDYHDRFHTAFVSPQTVSSYLFESAFHVKISPLSSKEIRYSIMNVDTVDHSMTYSLLIMFIFFLLMHNERCAQCLN